MRGMGKILGSGVIGALEQAGIDVRAARRVMIDIRWDGAVVVYTESYGDERVIEVVQALSGTEITYAKPNKDEGVVDHG